MKYLKGFMFSFILAVLLMGISVTAFAGTEYTLRDGTKIEILFNSGLQLKDGSFSNNNAEVIVRPGQSYKQITWFVDGAQYATADGGSIINHRNTTLYIYTSTDGQNWRLALQKNGSEYGDTAATGSFIPDNSLYYKFSSTAPLDANRSRSGSQSSYCGDFRNHTWGYYNEAGVALVYALPPDSPKFVGSLPFLHPLLSQYHSAH